MWDVYELEILFKDRLCGSVPQSRELIRPWLQARKPAKVPAGVREGTLPTLEELEEEVAETISEAAEEERITLGFQRDETGLFVRSGTLKAHLKDCANQLVKFLGVKAFRAKVANAVFVEPDRVHLFRQGTGEILTAEDGDFERPVHVMTPLGPRNALKRIRFVERAALTCRLLVLQKSEVTTERLQAILAYGAVHGYGGERGMGEGQYEWRLSAEKQ